jgi:hypothetical protein
MLRGSAMKRLFEISVNCVFIASDGVARDSSRMSSRGGRSTCGSYLCLHVCGSWLFA